MIFITEKNLLTGLQNIGFKSYDLDVLPCLNAYLLKYVKKELKSDLKKLKSYSDSSKFKLTKRVFQNVITQTKMINHLNVDLNLKLKEKLKNKFEKQVSNVLKKILKEYPDKHLTKSRLLKHLKKS